MSEAFKEFQTAPTLVFDEVPEMKEKAELAETAAKEPEPMDDSVLSDEERAMVDSFSQQIDLNNTNAILKYGAGVQKKMADFSEAALENVKSKDLGEVGDMLSNVVTELKSFDAEEESKGFLGGLFKKTSNKMTSMKAKYAKAEDNVMQICKSLEAHQVVLLKDIATLDKMYELNLTYFKELTMYILAGKKKLEQVRGEELPALIQKAEASGLAEDAQAAKDLEGLCQRFEKKLHDLDLTRMISIQTAPQIRLVQNSDTMMVEKIQSTVVNTISLWKSQMVLALGLEHSRQATQAQSAVTEMTNQLLQKNADMLKMGTVEAAREAERSIVDVKPLQHTNEQLISTLDEVMKIQTEGSQKRREAEAELGRIEGELKQKLLELRG